METDAGKQILENLLKKGIIGARHTSTKNTLKVLSKDQRGNGEKILKQLRVLGYVTFHPTSYGMQVSLNPAKVKEIKQTLNIP